MIYDKLKRRSCCLQSLMIKVQHTLVIIIILTSATYFFNESNRNKWNKSSQFSFLCIHNQNNRLKYALCSENGFHFILNLIFHYLFSTYVGRGVSSSNNLFLFILIETENFANSSLESEHMLVSNLIVYTINIFIFYNFYMFFFCYL